MNSFLFTDIESSTRLWEEHPNEMPEALAIHDSLLTSAVTAAGGSVLKTMGDGLIAVFADARQSIAAAVEAQTGLAAEDWGEVGSIRVRMGVHAGETDRRDDDHFGRAMNRAARIMSAAHGGQVLVSGLAADLLSDSDVHLRDLGTHRLKDLTEPEHLYQLVHPDLPSEFPAPKTLDARPHNLPLQMTEFLGRKDELDAIEVMLSAPQTRLLTLAGPGGAGKTRLSLQVAAEQLDEFDDGVFFVDLSAERDPEAAMEAIARTLSLPTNDGDAITTLKSRLRDKKMLLVLDNFEQVTSAAPAVGDILAHAPDIKVVVTSRETLRIRAERVFTVPAMSLPDPRSSPEAIGEAEAVQLFVERARAVVPDFGLTVENAPIVAEICLRLDGLPLALELAAARLNVFSPSDLLDRLRQRLDILGAGGRDLPDRQRTLWGAIGWSYELLDDDDRALFELLSIFSSTDLKAVERVAGEEIGDIEIIDSLVSLVDKSLVRTDTETGSARYSMLLMIKEFAAEQLAQTADGGLMARRAHAAYYSELAERLRERLTGLERDAALADLERDIGNLRTAWRFWVEQGDAGRLLGLIDGLWALHEARGWYRAAIELARDTLGVLGTSDGATEFADEELAVRTSLARALMAVYGYSPEVEEAFRGVLGAIGDSGPTRQRYPILRALATYYMNIADFAHAAELGRQLIDLGEREADQAIQIDGHYLTGAATSFLGDLERGIPHLSRAIAMHKPELHTGGRYRLGPNTGVVVRIASGIIQWQCGALERAVGLVADGLEVARQIDHPYSLAYALYHNGFVAMLRGRMEECDGFARELAEVAEANGYTLWGTLATVLEGVSIAALGDPERGLEQTEKGIALYQGLTTPPVFWPLIQMIRATVNAWAGHPDRAIPLIDEAVETVGTEGAVAAEIRIARGDILRGLSPPDNDGAEAMYRWAADQAEAIGLNLINLQAWTRLVDLRRDTGTQPDGSDELATAYAAITEGFDEQDMLAAKALLA